MSVSSLKEREDTPRSARPLALIDLAAQQELIRPQVESAILRVLDHGKYVMGPEVTELEDQLSAFTGAAHTLSCSSGTDALLMVLMAKGIGPGDAVICPAFTFTATPEVIALLGATPVFIDVEPDSFNMDVSKLPEAVETAKEAGLTPKVIVAVDLFGQPADYDGIAAFAAENDLWILADAAQSFGASYKGRKVGTLGLATGTSFFPAKPLGCYGDGGAIFTDDAELAEALDSIRVHGKGTEKYDNVRIGVNGRLDTLQAAILIEKLKLFPGEIEDRDTVAERYRQGLQDIDGVIPPEVESGLQSVWAQYTLRFTNGERDKVAATLKENGVPTAIYYPKPLHQQTAYKDFPVSKGGLPVSDKLAGEVLSLPMHPYLQEDDQARVIDAIKAACKG